MEALMNPRTFFLLLVSGLVAVTSCKDSGTNPRFLLPTPQGAYAYSSLDSNGDAIVRGWFTLVFSETGRVSGEWHFLSITNRTDIGPQTGDGQLTGSVVDTILYLNLNPNWVDNNVYLSGRLDAALYHGRWDWSTFVGITNHGTFEAVRN
jgi:hypothetical protein